MVAFSITPWLSEKTISNLKCKLAVGTGGRIRTRSTSWLPQFVRYILFKSILNSSITSCFSICPCENVLDHETFCVPCSSSQLLATRSRRILRQFWSNTSDYQSERRSVQKQYSLRPSHLCAEFRPRGLKETTTPAYCHCETHSICQTNLL